MQELINIHDQKSVTKLLNFNNINKAYLHSIEENYKKIKTIRMHRKVQ